MNNHINTLQSVVGTEIYQVWTRMLQHLIPEGRTHRLAPIIAGMLRYATIIALEKNKKENNSDTVSKNLVIAEELNDFKEIKKLLSEPIQNLFDDSNAQPQRTDYRGNHYSILDAVIHEYLSWYEMPWK